MKFVMKVLAVGLKRKEFCVVWPSKLRTRTSFPDGPVGWASTMSTGKWLTKEVKTFYLKGQIVCILSTGNVSGETDRRDF